MGYIFSFKKTPALLSETSVTLSVYSRNRTEQYWDNKRQDQSGQALGALLFYPYFSLKLASFCSLLSQSFAKSMRDD
jgi:hypothetical protein